MLGSYALGLGAIVAVAVAWVAVQQAWRRSFAGESAEPDVLARRMDCGGGCGCVAVCRKEAEGRTLPAEEELQ